MRSEAVQKLAAIFFGDFLIAANFIEKVYLDYKKEN